MRKTPKALKNQVCPVSFHWHLDTQGEITGKEGRRQITIGCTWDKIMTITATNTTVAFTECNHTLSTGLGISDN